MKNPLKTIINLPYKSYMLYFRYVFIFQIILISIFIIMVFIPLLNLIFDIPILVENPLYKFIDKIYFYLIGLSLSLSGLIIYVSNKRYKIVKKRIDNYLNKY